MRLLLITPPMLQFNAPYPATPYLTGYLKSRGYKVSQWDASLDLALKLFSAEGAARWIDEIDPEPSHPSAQFARADRDKIVSVVGSVVRFLQGKEPSLAYRINTRQFLPEGPRFQVLETEELEEGAFGAFTLQDRAKYFASLFLDDLADAIREGVDPSFELAKYGEKLASCQTTLDPLIQAVGASPSVIDQMMLDLFFARLQLERAQDSELAVGWTVPFPGNMYAACKMASAVKTSFPEVATFLGGGFVNTELRTMKDARLFDWFDAVTLDDGEAPLEQLLARVKNPEAPLVRTLLRRDQNVDLNSDPTVKPVRFQETPAPDYEGLKLNDYISMTEMLNPVYRLWSDGRWNKMILAHGCYWAKCSFCDTSLDYIQRYEPDRVQNVLLKMDQIARQTGQGGFHFVDEAAPPALLKALSHELIQSRRHYTWWGNIRFEKTFTTQLTELMSEAGCVAVTGGLEVASPRLLKLINKGVTLEQVARVTSAFQNAGIYVHAYLMYGFPSQTAQETVDSLEVVRQLFEAGCLSSAFWHRFSATVHSPIGRKPDAFGIKLNPQPSTFAANDVGFTDSVQTDHDSLGKGLRFALYNYMHGRHLEAPVHEWFEVRVPKTNVPKTLIQKALDS